MTTESATPVPGREPDPESPAQSPPGRDGTGGPGGAAHDLGGDIGAHPDRGSAAPGGEANTTPDAPVDLGNASSAGGVAHPEAAASIDPGGRSGQGADGDTLAREEQRRAGGP